MNTHCQLKRLKRARNLQIINSAVASMSPSAGYTSRRVMRDKLCRKKPAKRKKAKKADISLFVYEYGVISRSGAHPAYRVNVEAPLICQTALYIFSRSPLRAGDVVQLKLSKQPFPKAFRVRLKRSCYTTGAQLEWYDTIDFPACGLKATFRSMYTEMSSLLLKIGCRTKVHVLVTKVPK